MIAFIFTFGRGQVHPETREGLAQRFVRIEADTAEGARERMVAHFGLKWGFQYETKHAAGVERFKLIELPASEWPKEKTDGK